MGDRCHRIGCRVSLARAMGALKADLVGDEGPRISTMRNYRFAIVPYPPKDEFTLREEAAKLSEFLVDNGWVVLPISLQSVLLDRIAAQEPDWASRVQAMEKKLPRDRALEYLRNRLQPLVEGDEVMAGIADECGRRIREFAAAHPDRAERTLVLIGRAGALYPFFRSSALLKRLDGQTNNVPVVLLYPGEVRGPSSLSFMGVLEPDSDYRPRIYR
ncbi:MAG: DUF1788 domain-containing protein [Deltaproteobacteria bacterium]|nr:DUF1788 domain-containing protein [Deltaproteobacteria bacterium]